MAKLIPFIIIIIIILLINACAKPAPLGPERTGVALATTNCTACSMQVVTRFDSIRMDQPSTTQRLRFRYDSVTLVRITVIPASTQTLHVRIFDKDDLQVYKSADVTGAAGSELKFSYQFKYKE